MDLETKDIQKHINGEKMIYLRYITQLHNSGGVHDDDLQCHLYILFEELSNFNASS